MRKLILSALLLTVAAPVLAQVPPPEVQLDRRDGDRRDGDRRDGDRRGPDGRDYRGDQRGPDGDRRDGDRRDYRQDDHRDFRDGDRRDYRQDERRDFRDDRREYRQDEQYARFRGEQFYYPRGYSYRNYSIGTILPRAYFSQRYYIARPDYYRLPLAYRGTRWVRVGPDALLIRAYDGRIVRVIQGLFY